MMKELTINLSRDSYKIKIENNLIDKLDEHIYQVYKNKRIFIITDFNVSNIYLDSIKKILEKKYQVDVIILKPGEETKNVNNYIDVCRNLLDKKIRRNHLILALGGGVIGDLAGFVAATIFRGVNFINIPTTLLSQMDSSIGGKTGIDFNNQKNVIGAFKQPLLVLIDPLFLKTLPAIEISNGLGELIKHAVIGNENLFELLKENHEIDEDIIYESLVVKKKLVENDEFDQGVRMKLNFGHTFGHILEMKYNLKHGISVGLGMLMALEFGSDLNITPKNLYDDVKEVLEKNNLNTSHYDYKKYLDYIVSDKKNLSGIINFILIKKIGEALIYQIDETNLKSGE